MIIKQMGVLLWMFILTRELHAVK